MERNILRFSNRYKRRNLGIKLRYSVPINVFGPGLFLSHYGTIVVSKNAKVCANCRLHASTNIGDSAGKPEAPIIGDNVYIGTGAILFGLSQLQIMLLLLLMQQCTKVVKSKMWCLPVPQLRL